MLTVLLVIAILVLLIVVHEFGHFLAAKLFRVRVEEFGVGYPPRAFSFGRWGGTEYTLNWIPFGGFVRLFGDDDDGVRGKGTFVDAPRYVQAIILVAGVLCNVLTGWLLFAGAYKTGILHAVEQPTAQSSLLITDVVTASPADAAGLRQSDELISLSGSDGALATLTPQGVTAFVSERGGEELTVVYARQGATSSTIVRPAHAVVPDEAQRPAIGVGLALVTAESLSWPEALSNAARSAYNSFLLVLQGVGTILSQTIQGSPDLSEVTGPIGLVGAVGEATQNGWGYVLSLAGFISVNLAVINLIPIPALDGGRLVIVGLEAILRRKAPRLAVRLLNTIGIALIIVLMITVTFNDIHKLLV